MPTAPAAKLPVPREGNRRAFLAHLAAAGAATTSALTGCAHDIIPSDGIVDTHTHFYDPTRPQGVPWPPKEDTFLHRPVLPQEWKALARPLGVTSTVVVEASPWVADNAWILQLTDSDPAVVGLVGHLKPGKPGFAQDLALFTSHRRFRGIRIGGWDVPLASDRSECLRDLESIAERALALDVLVGPDQLPAVARLAALLPHLRIVVDHCANLRIDGKAPPTDWRRGLEAIAPHAQVFMKLSGLVEGTGRADGTAPSDTVFYRPVLDSLWEALGPRRLIFGSNWPVSARFASYATTVGIIRDYLATKDRSAQRNAFQRNARLAYGI